MRRLLLATALAAVLPTDAALAAACRSVRFADSVDVDGRALVLNGLGLRLATLLEVKVYVAALYVATPSRDASRVLAAGAPKRLELHFLRDVDADDLKAAWDEGFARNASAQLPALRAPVNDSSSRSAPMAPLQSRWTGSSRAHSRARAWPRRCSRSGWGRVRRIRNSGRDCSAGAASDGGRAGRHRVRAPSITRLRSCAAGAARRAR